MCRRFLSIALLLLAACRTPANSTGGHPVVNGGIPSRSCAGDAPVDKKIAHVPNVRGSWFNDVGGTKRLYVLEAGPRNSKVPTLVLIHGVGTIGTGDFYKVLEPLSRTRHVLAVDLPGFGRSDLEGEDFGPERLVRSVDVVTRACASQKLDVLGHSSGALAILFAAQRADDVRKLVVVDAAGILRPEVLLRGQLHQGLGKMRDKAPVMGKVVESLGDVLIESLNRLTPRATDVADTGLLGRSPPVLAGTRLLDFNFGEAIRDVRAQTLVLWGKSDRVMPPRIGHLLDDRIANSELSFIDGAGHVPMKDQPELFASIVAGYLNTGLPREPAEPSAPSENKETRVGHCSHQENVVLEGDYERVEVDHCEHVWLNKVRARSVVIHDSEGRIDNTQISDSLTVKRSELSLTGGSLRGQVALLAADSKLDIAGVDIVGDQAAIRIEKPTKIVFSVTPLKSPQHDRIFHGSNEYDAGHDL